MKAAGEEWQYYRGNTHGDSLLAEDRVAGLKEAACSIAWLHRLSPFLLCAWYTGREFSWKYAHTAACCERILVEASSELYSVPGFRDPLL